VTLRHIPWILVALRFTLAPLLLANAWDGRVDGWFVTGYVVAVVSDIFDGIIARRLRVSTPRLRQADSWADVTLYTCIAASAWLVYPEVVRAFQIPLLIALAAQLFLYAFNFFKFKAFPSYHPYSAKAWGLGLLAATVALFGFGNPHLLWLAFVLCLVNTVEEIAITWVLPAWKCDVLSIFHALRN